MLNCERVMVLNAGVNMTEGTPSQIAADPGVIRLYLGEPEPAPVEDQR
jgi:ABC-type branched-subunit amino acid transport system ATPase component